MGISLTELLGHRSLQKAVAARYQADFRVPGVDSEGMEQAAEIYAAMVAPHIGGVRVSRGAEAAIRTAQQQGGRSDIDLGVIRAAETALDAGRRKISLGGKPGEILSRVLGKRQKIQGSEPITVFQAPVPVEEAPRKTRKQERIDALPPNRVRNDKNRALFTGLDPKTGRYYKKGAHRPPKNK